ncbi:hypothetical protein, partial [Sphaerotilus sp.]|uniref:hypothetical protein n=1 Tax=Sphaerotilus sp. TaxID=2093942 RepID=UPI0034E25DD9
MVSRTADVLRRMFFSSWRREGKSESAASEPFPDTQPSDPGEAHDADLAVRNKFRARVGKPPRPVIEQVPGAHGASAASFAVLTAKLDYLDEADVRRVREAYRFADQAHLGQFR